MFVHHQQREQDVSLTPEGYASDTATEFATLCRKNFGIRRIKKKQTETRFVSVCKYIRIFSEKMGMCVLFLAHRLVRNEKESKGLSSRKIP